jgi:DNA-binding beta-propeller fold protein YncE
MRTILIAAAVACLGCASLAMAQGRLIAVDSNRTLYEVDMTTGALTNIGAVSANAGTTAGLAYDRATGTIYLTSTSTDSLYTLDLVTGNATLVGFYGDSTVVMHGLEWDSSSNKLWAASGGGGNFNFYDVNPTTGLATVVGPLGLTSFTNLVHDSLNNVLYATNSGTDSFYSIDRSTGTPTLIGPLNGSTNPNGLAYDWDNDRIFLVDNTTDTLYTINRATGAVTVIGAHGVSVNLLGLVYIPEPSSIAILGLGAIALVRRRR